MRYDSTPSKALQVAQQWVRDTTNGEKQAYFEQHLPQLQSVLGERMSATVAADFFNKMALLED